MKWIKRLLGIGEKKEKDVLKWEDSYYYALLKSHEQSAKFQDEKLLIDYKYRIKREALEKYNWWRYSDDMFFLPMLTSVLYVARNHNEVYPESHNFYVNEEYERLKNEHTEEEKKEIEERRAKKWKIDLKC